MEDPDKLVQIVQVHSRVDELERRLDDRTDNLRSEFSSKVSLYSVVLGILLTAIGFLGGLVAALILNIP